MPFDVQHSSLVPFRSTALETMASEKREVARPDASSGSNSDVEGIVHGDVNEKALLRKLDLRLLPAVSILYLLSFLDRSNGTFGDPSENLPHHVNV